MIFKTIRQEKEWAQLVAGGYMIVPVVEFAAETSVRMFGKQVVVTDILRLKIEQEALCRKLKIAYYDTVHSFWRGTDLRSLIYTAEEIGVMKDMINRQFVYGRGKQVAVYHDVGAGAHFHLQAPFVRGAWRP